MKTKTMVMTLAVCFLAVAVSFAGNPNMGTWKLNEAKSQIPAGAQKNTKVVYEAVGDSMRVTVDGIDGKGKPTHTEWTGKFDGKDYPLVGDSSADTRAYMVLGERMTELANKRGGKVISTGRIVVSADGKSRTVTVSGSDSMGMKVQYTAVYDKQ